MKVKNILVFLLSLVLFFGLFLLYDGIVYNIAEIESGVSEYSKKIEITSSFDAKIIGVGGETIVVQPIESTPVIGDRIGYYDYIVEASNKYEIVITDVNVETELEVGKILSIVYKYDTDKVNGVSNTYPQGKNQPYWFRKVEKIVESNIDLENMILYNGRVYQKHNLSDKTLDWLELSDEEKAQSEYYPWDLVEKGYFDLLSNVEEWGLISDSGSKYGLPTNFSVDLYQKDFIETDINDDWVYSVDSKFEIQKWNMAKQEWFKVETLYGDKEIDWDDGIEILELDSEIPYGYGINWEWLYGTLPSGENRIKKEIRVDKSEDDYSWRTVYWYFEIKE